jgi:hypothetical protein
MLGSPVQEYVLAVPTIRRDQKWMCSCWKNFAVILYMFQRKCLLLICALQRAGKTRSIVRSVELLTCFGAPDMET